MNSFKELKNNIKCPCESGKNYGDCCKNKKLVFGFEGNKLIKKTHTLTTTEEQPKAHR